MEEQTLGWKLSGVQILSCTKSMIPLNFKHVHECYNDKNWIRNMYMWDGYVRLEVLCSWNCIHMCIYIELDKLVEV